MHSQLLDSHNREDCSNLHGVLRRASLRSFAFTVLALVLSRLLLLLRLFYVMTYVVGNNLYTVQYICMVGISSLYSKNETFVAAALVLGLSHRHRYSHKVYTVRSHATIARAA